MWHNSVLWLPRLTHDSRLVRSCFRLLFPHPHITRRFMKNFSSSLYFLSTFFTFGRETDTEKNNPISGWGLIVRYPRVMRSNTWWQVSYQRNYINDLRAFSLLLLMTLIFHEHTQCFLFLFSDRVRCFFVSTLYRNEISTEWEPHVASRLYCNVKYPLNTCALAADWKWWGRRVESSSPVSSRQTKAICYRRNVIELWLSNCTLKSISWRDGRLTMTEDSSVPSNFIRKLRRKQGKVVKYLSRKPWEFIYCFPITLPDLRFAFARQKPGLILPRLLRLA